MPRLAKNQYLQAFTSPEGCKNILFITKNTIILHYYDIYVVGVCLHYKTPQSRTLVLDVFHSQITFKNSIISTKNHLNHSPLPHPSIYQSLILKLC